MKSLYTALALVAISYTLYMFRQRGMEVEQISIILLAVAGLISVSFMSKTKTIEDKNFFTSFNNKIMAKAMMKRNMNNQRSGMVVRARSKRGK